LTESTNGIQQDLARNEDQLNSLAQTSKSNLERIDKNANLLTQNTDQLDNLAEASASNLERIDKNTDLLRLNNHNLMQNTDRLDNLAENTASNLERIDKNTNLLRSNNQGLTLNKNRLNNLAEASASNLERINKNTGDISQLQFNVSANEEGISSLTESTNGIQQDLARNEDQLNSLAQTSKSNLERIDKNANLLTQNTDQLDNLAENSASNLERIDKNTNLLRLNDKTIAQLEEMAHGNCSFNGDTFRCECEPGWYGDFCNLDVNECITRPCHNGGHCYNTAGGYKCGCEGTGFAGPKCQEDIDECQSSPCLNGKICQNSIGSYSCRCPANYEGPNCESYFPYGPQTNVPETKVTGGGWTICHAEGFNVKQTPSSLAAIQNKCSKKKFMMGCRKTGSSKITLLAAAPDGRKALESTGSKSNNPGRIINGSKWYRRPDKSYGFAHKDSSLYLIYADAADTQGKDKLNPRGEMRLSYYLSGSGGRRCGESKGLQSSKAWERLYYHAD